MDAPIVTGPMSKLIELWTGRRMVVIAEVALTGIALHLVFR
jgi:hypothetical protein